MPAFIENTIAALSPTWALKRRMGRELLNSYKGGVPNRLSESWQTSQGYRFGTSSDRMENTNARDRGMQAYLRNPVARSLIQTEKDHVIGDGLNYQPSTDSEEWNREAVDRYYDWLENCSVRGPDYINGCKLQGLLWENSRAAGDIGVILVSRGADSLLQVVPSDNIATPDGMYADKSMYDGVRLDAFGKPQTFYVRYQDEAGTRRFEGVNARDFIFLPHTAEPNTVRGTTCFTTIFDLLAHLDRYVDGVSLAAWMATVFGIVFKQNNGGSQLTSLPTTLTNSQGDAQKALIFENGMFKYIGTDEDVAQVQAHQPMQQTPDFIRALLRMLGEPFDMPLEVAAKDMSTCNFASARIGLLPYYRSCRIRCEWFASHWSRAVRWWLSRERLRADDDPKKWTTPFPDRFWNHEMRMNAFDYTDPVSEAQSDLLQMDMKTKSPQMVIAERGRDAARILRDWEEWDKQTEDQVHSTMTRDPMPEPVAPAPVEAPPTDPVKAYARAYADIKAEMAEAAAEDE